MQEQDHKTSVVNADVVNTDAPIAIDTPPSDLVNTDLNSVADTESNTLVVDSVDAGNNSMTINDTAVVEPQAVEEIAVDQPSAVPVETVVTEQPIAAVSVEKQPELVVAEEPEIERESMEFDVIVVGVVLLVYLLPFVCVSKRLLLVMTNFRYVWLKKVLNLGRISYQVQLLNRAP